MSMKRRRAPVLKTKRAGSSGPAVRSSPGSTSLPSLDIRTILVPIDFSLHSRDALRYAIPMARQFRAKLHLIYVVEPTIYPADLGFGQVVYPSFEEELVEKGGKELQNIIDEDIRGSVEASARVRTGKPHQEILMEAEESNADLLIMATHGHTGVEHMLFGSTAERIVRNARCPVLTVRPAAQP